MDPIIQLRAEVDYLEDELRAMHEAAEDRSLSEDEQSRWDEGLAAVESRKSEIEQLEARKAEIAKLAPKGTRGDEGLQVIRSIPKPDEIDVRTAAPAELRDAALKLVERKVTDDSSAEKAERLARRSGSGISRHMVRFGSDVYADAFAKIASPDESVRSSLTPEESRALAVGTNTQGGFMVPTHLDPTILLSNAGTDNPYRQISSVTTLGPNDGNQWNGVSSAGVTASWDAEEAEVSDDAPTLAQPTVPTHKAAAFIPFSIEAEDDIQNLGPSALALFADAKDRLEGAAFATGSGSDQPTGIFTALDANTNVEVSNTTAAVLGAVDLYAVYAAVPPRDRGRSQWVMHVDQVNTIRQLGSSDPNFTVNLLEGGIPELHGLPVYESSDAPGTPSSATEVENWLVVGNFMRGFKIVDKVGLSVEFIPHLFATGSNRPSGQRGWYAHWRTGSDSVLDNAFRLLQDKTSA